MRLHQRNSDDKLLNQHLPNLEVMPLEVLPFILMIERGNLGAREKALGGIHHTHAKTTIYASKEGALNWITNSGPDLIFSVQQWSDPYKIYLSSI